VAERLVVVGGDAAGMTAASVARRARPDLEIVVLERGVHTSYAACGIPFLVGGEIPDLDDLVVRTPDVFRAKQDIDVRTGHDVVAIDPDRRVAVAVEAGTGDRVEVGFDQLLLATGARPIEPPWPGLDLPHVQRARTLHDAEALATMAEGMGGRPVALVGGGYIGIEMAEAFTLRGSKVTLIDLSEHLLGNLDPDMAALVAAAAEHEGVELRLGHHVTAIQPDRVVTREGDVPAELVVVGVGVVPNGEVAATAGIELGVRGSVVVDERQRTSLDGAFAAGDCAQSIHRVSGQPVWVPLGTVANKHGRVAGLNLAGIDATFPGVLGTAITKFCDTEIARTGLSADQATAAGLDPVGTTIESSTRAGYYPGAGPITVKLVHERGSHRLLGGQIVGAAGAGKRIDTIATAVWAGLTVDELLDVDLAYAPPFSPVWDPVLMAARQAVRLNAP
jgi:NADPH-dependent 2,4-dienoyl-CoA reductase/sulfur reductase-like enzyme